MYGAGGPEAGVWVSAETRDLGVRYIKSVVTDDRGRFVVPDLPSARYQVWARGYGLVDSAKSTATPGMQVNITAVPAPNDAAAAKAIPLPRAEDVIGMRNHQLKNCRKAGLKTLSGGDKKRIPGALKGKIKIAKDFDVLPKDIAEAFGTSE